MAWLHGAFVLALTLFVFTPPARAVHGEPPRLDVNQYKIDGWQTEHGLPQTTVQSMFQSRDGALWVGTGGGLARFDGVRFTTFETAPVSEIASRPIFGFMEDAEGWVWIGHSRGASRYKDGRFERTIPPELTEGRRVWTFVQEKSGVVWAATENGLVRWEKGETRRYAEAEGLPFKRLRTLALDRDGTLWIGTSGGGLFAFRDGRFEAFTPKNGFPSLEVRHVLADAEGGIWAATAGAGLVRVKDGRFQSFTMKDGLPTDQLTYLARDTVGALWIGTWGAGLVRLLEGKFSASGSAGGLGGDQMWAVHVDREGSIWTGSWNGGLNRLSQRAFVVFGKPEGVSGDNVRTVMHARDGSTWVATAGGGVDRVADGRITHLSRREGLASDEASSLLEDRDGSIWVATYTAGISRIRPGRPIENFGLREGLPNVDVRVLYQTRDGVVWAGTSMGLARFDGRSFAAVREAGAPAEGVVSMLQDRAGTLWIGTSGDGLYRYRDGRFDGLLTRRDGLLSNWIVAMHEDPSGAIWIGTNGEGINRYKDGRISRVRPEDGLWDGIAQVFLPDAAGNLWITCNRGFYRVKLADLNAFADGRIDRVASQGFGPGDALRSTTFAGNVQPAGAVDGRGHLWLPSLRGVVIVDPARLPGGGEPPAVRVEQVVVNGKATVPGAEIVLPPGPHAIGVRYSAGTLANAERVRFRYRMEGATPDWIDAGRNREATFPALPHGRYAFHVAATVDGQRWSELAAPMRVRVQPHFWQTPWFTALALLGLFAAAWSLFQLRTLQLRRRQAHMERVIAEKTEELRIANEHLSRLSYADALTGLPNRRRLDDVLETEWRRAMRSATPLAVVIADIDAFKPYNDSLGHLEGDRCLVQIADVIRQSTSRAGDFAARYGGEEFLMLVPGADEYSARLFSEGLRLAVENRAIPHPASRTASVVTVSVGFASIVPTAEMTPSMLVTQADAALYRAKQRGGNQVQQLLDERLMKQDA
jgi:diguanylate cyclase (GGDEF)-like protein